MGVLVHPLVIVIPRFIQLITPLPPLKSMVQSRRGVVQILEVPVNESPHTVIEPSALRAAKEYAVE
jgi:hypothetical protein